MKLLERDRENREKGRQEGLSLGREEGRQKLQKVLFDLVKDGTLTISAAAEKAELEPSEFERRYYENLQ